MRGSGKSMLPYYGDDSVLIIETASYNKLKMGTSVVYRDRNVNLVGHLLQENFGNDWYACSVNNKKQDPQVITERNYISVILAFYLEIAVEREQVDSAQTQIIPLVMEKNISVEYKMRAYLNPLNDHNKCFK